MNTLDIEKTLNFLIQEQELKREKYDKIIKSVNPIWVIHLSIFLILIFVGIAISVLYKTYLDCLDSLFIYLLCVTALFFLINTYFAIKLRICCHKINKLQERKNSFAYYLLNH